MKPSVALCFAFPYLIYLIISMLFSLMYTAGKGQETFQDVHCASSYEYAALYHFHFIV